MEKTLTDSNFNDILSSLKDNDVITYDDLKFKVKIDDSNLEFKIMVVIKKYSFRLKLLIWLSSLIISYYLKDYIFDLLYFFSESSDKWLIYCIFYLCYFFAHFVYFKKYVNFLIELLFEKNHKKIVHESNFLKLVKNWKRSTDYPLDISVNIPKNKIILIKEISSSKGEEIMYWK